jgi:L-threonylcarbamoyladenylate synthase
MRALSHGEPSINLNTDVQTIRSGGYAVGMAVILDWREVAAPDDLARQITKALAEGSLVALPTETGCVLAADPGTLADPARPPGLPNGLGAYRFDGYFDPAVVLRRINATPAERAIAMRLWPGPIGWVSDDLPFPAWVPLHMAMATVLAAHQGPLALFELNDGQPVDFNQLESTVTLVLTDGTPRSGPVTLIRANDRHWSLVRAGIASEPAVHQALARKIVFVCTGNTCRSPMAEGLFKHRLAERLNCGVDELPSRGLAISSVGISALANDAATREAADILAELGIDLSAHRSRPASTDIIGRADDVIAMTRSHLVTLVSKYPVLSGSLRLLCGPDGDLDDPIGGGIDVYRACAGTIQRHVDRLILEMGLS